MTFHSSYDPAAYSFKKRIISRIVASVQYYLKNGDVNRAESGLITVLNVVGYLSSDILEVFFLYLRHKYPSNYNATAAYINNLRPRESQNFENRLLDHELLLCAFHEKNSTAIKQMILRLEESSNDASINMIRCLCVTGIPNLLQPNASFKHYFTPNFVSNHRMVAQIAQAFQSSLGKSFTDQHFSAIHSHTDLVDLANIQDLDYSKFNSYLLFPGFPRKFKESSLNLIMDKHTSLFLKLRLLGYLTCTLVFLAQSQQDLIETLKNCFDVALYVRASSNSSTNEFEPDRFYPQEIPFFQKNLDIDALPKAILLLLEI